MDSLWSTSRLHWWRQVDNMLIELHLSETSGSYRAQTWMARFTGGDANHYAISPPLSSLGSVSVAAPPTFLLSYTL